MRKLGLLGVLVGLAIFPAALASPALATTTAHSTVIGIACPSETTWVDANAFNGQKIEVTAYYNATGKVCRLVDASGNVLFDPSL